MSAIRSVIRTRIKKPCATQKQIAKKCGVSEIRVRQILVLKNLPTKRWLSKYICNSCQKTFRPKNNGCSKIFCSPDCSKAYNTASVECDGCKKPLKMSYALLTNKLIIRRQEHIYCTRSCRSRFIGQNYGFKAHPENTGGRSIQL